ncbi:hypothetical protein [Polyangium sp. y55x31]|uniref:hypothetical protein n=1 Tax=Polyangium sp. y55x31 TaxID=3042688 RepID=UPI0024829A27|nr:hypothetical protein [Polyangium sp. y55x31]MDI1480415.1 hypothetical protein [Polyangium sp. y55x31]
MSSACAGGVCVPPAPGAWKGPLPFHYGASIDVPACPESAPIVAFDGFVEPASPSCSTCSCDAPIGTCHRPETWTVSSAACADPGLGVNTNFDPPTSWDGSCNEDKAIIEGKLCGAVPCVRSITISPPVIEEQPCTVHVSGDPAPSPPHAWHGNPWEPMGRACTSGASAPTCTAESGKVCVPSPPGFSPCVLREGDHPCPEGWGDRHLLYGQVEDDRACSACTCSEPSGGTCDVLASIFSEPACGQLNLSLTVSAGMVSPCHDFMPGTQLSGKRIDALTYEPGTCTPSGGELVGDLVLAEATTVCCYAPVI